ncbi:hypothetical protein STENM36S_06235 [Streptomyces tendae]
MASSALGRLRVLVGGVGLVGGGGGLVDEHRAVVGAQAGLGDLLDLLRGHLQDPLHGGEGELRVAEQDGVPAQFVRAARDRAQSVQPLALELGLGALHLLGRGPLFGEPGQLLVDGRLDDRHLHVTGRLHVQPPQGRRPGEPQQTEPGGDGRAVAAYEPVVQAGRLAAAQDGQGQVGRVARACAFLRQAVGRHQGTGRDLLLDDLAQLTAHDVGQRTVPGRLLAVVRGDGAEVLLDPGERLLRVDVADDRQHRVVRCVVGAEERARVFQGRRVKVRHRTDRRVVVGVPLRVGEGGQLLEGRAVGDVVVALAAFVLDDVPLVLHRLLVQGGQQGAHAVGLQPEGELQLVGGHGLEVVGPLEAGGAVERAAGALHQLEVTVALDLGGALEHEVLEKVSQAGAPLDLVARADVVPEAHRRDRGQVVLGEHHAQAVGQAVLGRCQAAGACLGCGRVTHGHVRPFDREILVASRGEPPGGILVGGTAEFRRSCHCMQACGPPVEFPDPVRRERERG